MASKLSPFPLSHVFRSPLVKNQPESVPSIDDLEHLQSELKVVKQRVMDKRRKAVDDVRIIEESIRRMTEKEKGKSKAVDKVKRERDCEIVLISFLLFKLTPPSHLLATLPPSKLNSSSCIWSYLIASI